MEILIVGLGVIGSTYGYLFHKANFKVEHLIREESSKASISQLEIKLFDGRTNEKGEWKTDHYPVVHAQGNQKYDFIFVSVPSGSIAEVLKTLRQKKIQGTVILACGIWEDHDKLEEIMNGWNYILGYPVAGGNIENTTLNCWVFDYFMLEKREKARIDHYGNLENIFSACGISLEKPYDMLEWIWIHMAVNAGVITVAGKYGDVKDTAGSAEKLMDSSKELSEAVISIRETVKIIEARGVTLKNYNNELLPYKIPSKLAGLIMKKMFANSLLTRKIMTLHSNLEDLLFVCGSIYQYGKQKNISAPVFYENCKKIGLSVSPDRRDESSCNQLCTEVKREE